jgi:hypothetical protein
MGQTDKPSSMLFPVVLVGLLLSQAPTPAPATAGRRPDRIRRKRNLARTRGLRRGAAINTADRRGFTPSRAAATGNLDMVRLLLESGAAVQGRATDGTTP